jgi:iron complex outermembrane receptor protein
MLKTKSGCVPIWVYLIFIHCIPLALVPAAALAQDSGGATATAAANQPESDGLQEIVVTAERRESTVQKTAASITAVTPETLATQQVVQIFDLNALLPNAQIYPISQSAEISIRGIGPIFVDPRGDPAVPVSVDGLPFVRNLPLGFSLLDVSRVEALNGPQGTLYGRNAVAGAINIITNKPDNKLEGSFEATGGNLGTNNFSGVINVPVTDTFALRAAYERDRSDGYVQDYYNDVHSNFGRVSALWTPTDNLSILFEWENDKLGGHGQAPEPFPCAGSTPYNLFIPKNCNIFGFPFQVQNIGHVSGTTNVYQMNVDYDAGPVTLTSITGFITTRQDLFQDQGALFYDQQNNRNNDFSEELRVSGKDSPNHAGGLAWVAGAYIFDSTGAYFYDAPGTSTDDYPQLPQRSQAGFGQVTYGITDRLRLTAGGRFTHDFKGLNDGLGNSLQYSASKWTYKGGVEYDLAPANMLYATVSTGYVSGGPNGGTPNAVPPPNYGQSFFQPETVTAYEVGSKNRFDGGRLQVNADVYYYDFDNYQFFNPGFLVGYPGLATIIQNIPKVNTYGLELSSAFAATSNDQFTASLDLAHGEFGAIDIKSFGAGPGGFTPITESSPPGNALVNLPHWQGMLGYNHTFALPNQATIVFSVASKLSGGFFLTPTGQNVPDDHQGAYTRTDLALAYHFPADRFVIRAWVRNVENKFVAIGGLGAGDNLQTVLPPRTYGLTVSAKFGE